MVVKDADMIPRARKSVKKPRIREENEVQNAANSIFTRNSFICKQIVLTQELKLVKALAGNDPVLRAKVLKNLKIWLNARGKSSYAFTNNDLMRLWKGLFYCMWMTDKPLPQEEMAENLGSLISSFDDVKLAIQFFKSFLATMAIEWSGIDKWRLDKFMMLVRRVTRKMLTAIHEKGWDQEHVALFLDVIDDTLLDDEKCPRGLNMHFHDLFLEEVAKVSEGQISEETVHQIIEPYVKYYLTTKDISRMNHIQKTIFYHLMLQSEFGQMYQEKFECWKASGFPTEHIDDLEVEVEIQDEDEDNDEDEPHTEKAEKVLDPRAGNVNVVIDEIPFNINKVIEMFEQLRYKPFATSKGKKHMKFMIKKFKKFANGQFPLGPQSMPTESSLLPKEEKDFDVTKAAENLIEYERDLNEQLNKDRKNMKKKKNDRWDLRKNPYPNFVKDSDGNEKPTKENVWIEEDNIMDEPAATVDEKKKPEKTKEVQKKAKKRPIQQVNDKSDDDDDIEAPRKINKRQKIKEANVVKERKLKFNAKMSQLKEKQSKKLMKIKEDKMAKQAAKAKKIDKNDEWSQPLKEGEVEIFVSSMKKKVNEANEKIKLDKVAQIKLDKNSFETPKKPALRGKNVKTSTPAQFTPGGTKKRVQIALNQNVSQEHDDYIEHVKNSPNISFDGSKKPTKGLLKSHCLPSPINPFYNGKPKQYMTMD